MAFDHFVAAQAPIYETVLGELKAGRKTSHWMWFVFPQIEGLGRSPMAQRYALQSLNEAAEYLAHSLLGERLRECSQAVLSHRGKSAHAIFGSPDDLKFHSSMTLFHRAAPDEEIFREALEAFFDGEEDSATLARI